MKDTLNCRPSLNPRLFLGPVLSTDGCPVSPMSSCHVMVLNTELYRDFVPWAQSAYKTLLSFCTQVAAPGLSGSERVCWNLSTKPDQTCPKPDLAYQGQTCVHSFSPLCRVIVLSEPAKKKWLVFNFFSMKAEGLYLLCNIFLEVVICFVNTQIFKKHS